VDEYVHLHVFMLLNLGITCILCSQPLWDAFQEIERESCMCVVGVEY
jgi:hypothetical protein